MTDENVIDLGTPDEMLAEAVGTARAAARDVGGDTVGEHLGVGAEEPHVVTHRFASTLPGYRGWHWAVTLTRVDGAGEVTVDEVVQLPGPDALLAPVWVPWQERVRPGDLSPGELLPTTADDVRLVPAYTDSGDPAVEEVAFELGLGRRQVMSRDGRAFAADRWHTGDRGPDTPMARQAPFACGTCGFLLPLAGALAAGFGVCGNELTDSDGEVVSVEYGCGAHSDVVADRSAGPDVAQVVYDDGDEITSVEPRGADVAVSGPDTSGEPSGGAAHPPMPSGEVAADEAEGETGDAGPGPDEVAVAVEPAPQSQADDGGDEPQGGTH